MTRWGVSPFFLLSTLIINIPSKKNSYYKQRSDFCLLSVGIWAHPWQDQVPGPRSDSREECAPSNAVKRPYLVLCFPTRIRAAAALPCCSLLFYEDQSRAKCRSKKQKREQGQLAILSLVLHCTKEHSVILRLPAQWLVQQHRHRPSGFSGQTASCGPHLFDAPVYVLPGRHRAAVSCCGPALPQIIESNRTNCENWIPLSTCNHLRGDTTSWPDNISELHELTPNCSAQRQGKASSPTAIKTLVPNQHFFFCWRDIPKAIIRTERDSSECDCFRSRAVSVNELSACKQKGQRPEHKLPKCESKFIYLFCFRRRIKILYICPEIKNKLWKRRPARDAFLPNLNAKQQPSDSTTQQRP